MFMNIFNSIYKKKAAGAIPAMLLASLLFASCVSYDSVVEGSMRTPYMLNGATVLLDPGEDKVLVLGARNDSQTELKVRIRPIGGKIGYNLSGSSNYGLPNSDTITAGYLTMGNDAVIMPGEEAFIIVYLNNWARANTDFSHRMEIIVDDGVERHAINIQATQDDIFDDAAKTFLDNKLGRNNFPGNSSVNFYGVSDISGFHISIPVL